MGINWKKRRWLPQASVTSTSNQEPSAQVPSLPEEETAGLGDASKEINLLDNARQFEGRFCPRCRQYKATLITGWKKGTVVGLLNCGKCSLQIPIRKKISEVSLGPNVSSIQRKFESVVSNLLFDAYEASKFKEIEDANQCEGEKDSEADEENLQDKEKG